MRITYSDILRVAYYDVNRETTSGKRIVIAGYLALLFMFSNICTYYKICSFKTKHYLKNVQYKLYIISYMLRYC